MRKVGCLVNLDYLIVGFLGVSVLKVDIYRLVKKERATSGFGLQVMLGGSLFVSYTCTLQLSCGNISKIV